jgi:hypothetical protein
MTKFISRAARQIAHDQLCCVMIMMRDDAQRCLRSLPADGRAESDLDDVLASASAHSK